MADAPQAVVIPHEDGARHGPASGAALPDAELPDAALVARVREGDASAFDTLVRRHLRAAQAVAYALLGDRDAAEDVCQDAFVAALDRIDDCRRPERFGAWLTEIVRNRAHNRRAYDAVRAASPLEEAPAASVAARSPSPAEAAERSELRSALWAALAALRAVQREVVLLHDLDGLPHREIASALGMSEVMSRQHLFVARRTLRRHLQQFRENLRERRGSRPDPEHSDD